MGVLKVTWSGALPGGEVWSTSAAFSGPGVPNLPIPQAQMNKIAADIAAIAQYAVIRENLSTSATYTRVTVTQTTMGGTMLAKGVRERTSATAGLGTATRPHQCAMVLSLRSATATRSGRGRMYWPSLTGNFDAATLRVSASYATSFVTAMNVYLAAVRGLIDTELAGQGVYLAVHSKKDLTAYQITELEVGDIYDVQRRRRDKAIENRVAQALA